MKSIRLISGYYIWMAVFAVVLTSASPAVSRGIDVTPPEAQELIADHNDLTIIDVSPHYSEEHIPGAFSYFLGDGSLDAALPELDKNGKYLVYCHTDAVSQAATTKMVDTGFRNVWRLSGNFGAWKDAGYEVVTSAYIDISASDARDKIENDSGLVVIDVSPVYTSGHLPGAVNYSLGDGTLDSVIPYLDKTGKYLVYCHTDEASVSGAQKLIDADFAHVWRLAGNYSSWTGSGFPTVKSTLTYSNVAVEEANSMTVMLPDLIVIDVSPLYASGHITNARNYPLSDGSLDAALPYLNKSDQYLVYCHFDDASMAASQKMVDSGFSKVSRLEGGFTAWKNSGYSVEQSSYADISPITALDVIENHPDLIIIDVSPLYTAGHIPDAVNYPLGSGSLDTVIPNLDKNGEYLVYCHSDAASISGAQKLVDAGFTTVSRLEGNFSAWKDAGYRVVVSPGFYFDITAAEAKDMIDTDSGLIIIDVSQNYAEGHVPGAVNYFNEDGSLDNAIQSFDKEITFLVYAHMDEESIEGARKLADAGFENVYRLEGNFGAWVDAGYTVEVLTSVEADEIPYAFRLGNPYPNPFNPSTTIQFEIPVEGKVSLVVYNIVGSKVNELVNSTFNAGLHSVTWDGKDDNGNLISSGVYFYRLSAGQLTAHGKVMFLR